MTDLPPIPRKGDLYALSDGSYMGRPSPAAVVADGLFRWRDKPTRRRPERFVEADARAGRGESLELYTPVLYNLEDRRVPRDRIEAVAGRLSELAATLDLSVLNSAAAVWGDGREGSTYDARTRRATVTIGAERHHVIFIAFDAKLREWGAALADHDTKVAEHAERKAREEEAEAKNTASLTALRRFAEARGLEPVHAHVAHMGGNAFNARVHLSPDLVDALIAGGKP